MKIESGEYIIVILHTPREKLFGILDEINAAGVSVRGIDLGYFEDWSKSIAAGEQVRSFEKSILEFVKPKPAKSR